MKSRHYFWALAIIILGFSFCGCSGEESVLGVDPEIEEGPSPLASFRCGTGGGSVSTPTDYVAFNFGYYLESSAVFYGWHITNDLAGQTIEITDEDPTKVASFFSMLNNGEDNLFYRGFRHGSNSGGTIGWENPESEVLSDRDAPNGSPDLFETPASRIEIYFEEVSIECPGRDPNGDGNWLDYRVSVVVSFF